MNSNTEINIPLTVYNTTPKKNRMWPFSQQPRRKENPRKAKLYGLPAKAKLFLRRHFARCPRRQRALHHAERAASEKPPCHSPQGTQLAPDAVVKQCHCRFRSSTTATYDMCRTMCRQVSHGYL